MFPLLTLNKKISAGDLFVRTCVILGFVYFTRSLDIVQNADKDLSPFWTSSEIPCTQDLS